MAVRLKRAYDQPGPTDGYRVLIDRLWPRAVPREKAQLDEWLRELAPSTELRRWFGHDPARFAEFSRRYVEELSAHEDKVRELRGRARRGRLTLVYGARDTEHNDAVVLAELLRGEKRPAGGARKHRGSGRHETNVPSRGEPPFSRCWWPARLRPCSLAAAPPTVTRARRSFRPPS